MTGVNPVTLRAWERRYGLIRPQRTPKGHRLYTEQDLERIQQVLMLLERGIPISQAKAALDGQTPAPAHPPEHHGHRNRDALRREWLEALSALDERRLEQAYASALGLFSMDEVLHELALPLLEELQTTADNDDDTAAALRRQFLRTFLRVKLAARVHHQGAFASGPRLLLAAPAGSCDELPLLLLAAMAQSNGYRCISLGTDVPLPQLAHALDIARCAALAITGTGPEPPDGLMRLLQNSRTPVFLLPDAAHWADGVTTERILPIHHRDDVLAALRQRVPPCP